MRLAVIGGGLFGCTAAIHASREGHRVHLFERTTELMQGASLCNQWRLHGGYHYPRSLATGEECREALSSFRREYGETVIDGKTIYGIASEDSRTTPAGFLLFCARSGLPFHAASGPYDRESLSVAVTVPEARIDPGILRGIVNDGLLRERVVVRMGETANASIRNEFDAIIVAAYAGTNAALEALGCEPVPFQYEVVEKPILRLPDEYADFSMVVMDGPFCSLDPLGDSVYHVMGHVKHAIWHTNTGVHPEVPDFLRSHLEGGARRIEHTRFVKFIEDGSRFMPFLKEAQHAGSMYTIRAVLADRDHDDARPTLVERVDDKVVRIFSGKLGTCVDAARRAVEMIGDQQRAAA